MYLVQQTILQSSIPLHKCKKLKLTIVIVPVNLEYFIFPAENKGLSNTRLVVFTYKSRACMHWISVLQYILDLLKSDLLPMNPMLVVLEQGYNYNTYISNLRLEDTWHQEQIY